MGQSEPPLSGSSCSFRVTAARAALAAFAVVLALSAAWALQAPAEAQSIRDGSFIRQSGTEDVYRVKIVNGKRFKWLIVNEAAFCSYGCPWGSVINVSRSVLNRYTTSTLARRDSNPAVWLFAPSGDSGTRRWLNITAREFEAAGLDWDAVHSITTTDFNQYREVRPPLTCADFNVCNEPPRITGTRNLSFDAGERVSSQRVATISDRDTRLSALRVRVSGLPSGWRHSFSTSSGRLTVSGTAPSRAGPHRVTITASDGRGSDTERFTITVNETHDPEITLVNDGFGVQAGQRVTSRRVATISDRDTRLRDLEVQVSGLPSGWRHSFSTSSGRLTVSGTAPSRAGSHRVTIRASDRQGSDTERFTITVAAPDCAETIQSGSFIRRSGTEDVYRVKIVGGKRFKWLILNEAAFNSYGVAWDQICDTSQSVLNRYTTSNLARRGSDPEVWRFASSGDSGTRRWLRITPSEFERAGYDWDAVFSLRPGDFNSYTAATSPITCDAVGGRNVCDEPPIVVVGGDRSWVAGSSVSERVATVSDEDTPLRDLTVDVSGLPAGLTHSFDTSNGDLRVSGTAPSSAGSHQVTIRATDGQGSDVERFTITVTAAPTDCAEAIQDGSFIRRNGTGDVYRVRIADGKRFKWLILNEAAFNSYGTAWSQICDTSQSVLNRYTTSDLARRGSDDEVWRFAPSGDSGTRRWLNMSASEFEAAGFDWAAVHSLSAGDFGEYTEGEELTCADFNVCPEPESTATGQANEPPEIANLTALLTVTEGQNVDATQVATVTDSEDSLRLNEQVRINGLPPGLAAHLSSTGQLTISGTVEAGTARTYTATITANDGTNLGVAEDFQIIVLEGEGPTFDPAVFVVEERLILGRSETVQLAGASGGSPPLTYTLRDAPAGMVFDAGALTLSGTPTGATGEHTMYLRATDSAGHSAEQQITYTIGKVCDYVVRDEPLLAGNRWRIPGEWDSSDCTSKYSERAGSYSDTYAFRLTTRADLEINLDSRQAYAGTYMDAYMYLVKVEGDSERILVEEGGWVGLSAKAEIEFLEPGEYRIRVVTRSAGETGRYWLNVYAKSLSLPLGHRETCLPQDYDRGVVRGTTLINGRLEDGDCSSTHGGRAQAAKADLYAFSLEKRATVIVAVATTSPLAHRIVLAEANGDVLADGLGLRQRRLNLRASVSERELPKGTYWIEVATGPDGELQYSVSLTVAECSVIHLDLSDDPTQEQTGSLAKDDCQASENWAWTDSYTFRLERDGYVEISVQTKTDSSNANARAEVSPRLRLTGGSYGSKRRAKYGKTVETVDKSKERTHATLSQWLSAGEHHLHVTKEDAAPTAYDLKVTRRMLVADSSTAKEVAAKYAPTLKFDKSTKLFGRGERFFPTTIETMIYRSELKRDRSLRTDPTVRRGAGLLDDEDKRNGATALEAADLVERYNDEKYYLDIDDGYHEHRGPKVVYTHVAEMVGGTVVQYWFFSLYNATGSTGVRDTFAGHEGDWEGISLYFEDRRVNEVLRGNIAPTEVGFASHEGGFAGVRKDAKGSAKPNAMCGQMDVYVARNRHASYPKAGEGSFLGAEGGADGDDTYWGNHIAWTPQWYSLRVMPVDSESWFHWEGRWGANGGPRGPQFGGNDWFWHRPVANALRAEDPWTPAEFDCSGNWTKIG